jgi:hypothetical protein
LATRPIRRKTSDSDSYIFTALINAASRSDDSGGSNNIVDRLDPLSKYGQRRSRVKGYDQAMLAAACDILEKEGYTFPSTLAAQGSIELMQDIITAVKTAKEPKKSRKKKGADSGTEEEEDLL